MDHRIGRREVEAAPAGFQADQEQRHLAGLEAAHRLPRGRACRRAARRSGCRRRCSRGFIRSSIEVNCENNRMRRPSGIISPIISSRSSSLAGRDLAGAAVRQLAPAAGRSRPGAASAAHRARRRGCAPGCARRSAARTVSYSVARIVSYSSRWSGARVMRRRMVCLGGSSVATSALVRRRMNGRMRCTSCAGAPGRRSSRSACGSAWRNSALVPSRPGIRNANCDHNSSRLFSIGVPERQSRCARCRSWHTARVARASGLLIACASSSTTMCQAIALHLLDVAGQHGVGGDDDMRVVELFAALAWRSSPCSTTTFRCGANLASSARPVRRPGWSAPRSAPARSGGLPRARRRYARWSARSCRAPCRRRASRPARGWRRCCSQSTPCCW